MAQETLKITITADNQQAVKNIQETVTATNSLGNAFKTLPNTSNRATDALSNLSRVAQDAPYGFIGIANNLNPLLESFQRLQKESGSSSSALKQMAQGLMGPAGIGLALGVASSLLVTFGDKLFQSSAAQKAAAEKTKENTDRLKEQKTAIDQVYSSTAQEATQVSSLVAVLQNENETRNRKVKALEALKKLNPEIFNGLTLEKGAVEGLNLAYDTYIANLSNIITLKIKQKELEDITEKILKKQGVTLTQEAKDIAATGKALRDSANSRKTDVELRNQGLTETLKQQKEENELNGLLKQQKQLFADIVNLSKNIKVPNEYNAPKVDKTLTPQEATDLINQINRTNTLLTPLEIAPEDTYFKDEKKKFDDFLNFITGHNQKKADLLKKGFDEEKKQLEDLNKEYAQFANAISQSVTSALFGMYDAMQQGASATQALGDMFTRLLRQMAEMVVQAAIFAGILSLISGGAAGGGVSFLGAFGKILGIPKMAAGGVATGPTLAMIGEGSESEAVLPLSKLGNMMRGSFNAGSMGGGNGSGLGQFVLRGQDLLLSVNRAQKASNLKGQNISLA
jgi:hypothetical protein